MVDMKPVSIGWQMIFAAVPILNLWAAYKIKKLRVFFLLFWALPLALAYAPGILHPETFFDFQPGEEAILNISELVLWIVGIIMMRKWSINWNEIILRAKSYD